MGLACKMASTSEALPLSLQQFLLKDIEGLDKRREKGRGSYGAVYEVRITGLPCIAKRLHDILVGRGQEEPVSVVERRAAIRKFREECVLLSGLRHPNIVQFMGVHCGSDEADISLIMEYVHMDLEHCMKTYPDIPLPYKTSILRDVTYGLTYLHSLNIVHRDLNAGNILLTESLRAKIADLGVAKLLDRETAMIRTSNACPGALGFMAPESLEESPKYGVKLDVFSFGHLAIYLVNQKPPRTLDSAITVKDVQNKQRQVGKRRRALDQMGGSRHPLYSTVVQCLSDTPDQRPTSRDLVRRMEEICKQHPIPHENTLQTLAELTDKVELENELTTRNQHIAVLRKSLKAKDQQAAGLSGSPRTKDSQLAELKELKCEVRQLHGHSPMTLSPTPRALKSTSDPSGELRGAHRGQTVVGIDLDMSSCSMSYCFYKDDQPALCMIDHHLSDCTVPVVLLLSKLDGHNCRVKGIGKSAESTKNHLPHHELSKYHYFELDMLLYRHKNADQEMSITSFGEPFYLVEVLAFLLKYLKECFMRHVGHVIRIVPAGIHWVIAVPVELNRLIREAASLACFSSRSNDEGICKLTPFGNRLPPSSVSPTKNITIASRSYCTALGFCNYRIDDMAYYSDRCDFHKLQKRYLIVDVGKSTVDITALVYTPTDNCYEFVVPTVTHAVGGMQVNQNFSKFLQELVNDHEFSRFVTSRKFFSVCVSEMINYGFEELKEVFCQQTHSHDVRLILPFRFGMFYENQLQRHDDSKITYNSETSTLVIKCSKMAEFFQPVLQAILRHVMCALDKIPLDNIDAVCFAGEFGGLQYVYEHMKAALSIHHQLRQAAFLVPRFFNDAVASQGAVHYRQPHIISQIMNVSYGINASVPFQEDELVEKNTVFYCKGRLWHQNMFLPFVYQGEQVKTTDIFTASDLLPPQQSQTEIIIHVYRSTNPKVRYTTDEDTEKIGELTLDLPNPNNLPNSERKLKVSMTFTSAEIIIRAQALYLPEQPTVSTVL